MCVQNNFPLRYYPSCHYLSSFCLALGFHFLNPLIIDCLLSHNALSSRSVPELQSLNVMSIVYSCRQSCSWLITEYDLTLQLVARVVQSMF